MHHSGVQADGKLMDIGAAIGGGDVERTLVGLHQRVEGFLGIERETEAAGKHVHRAQRDHAESLS